MSEESTKDKNKVDLKRFLELMLYVLIGLSLMFMLYVYFGNIYWKRQSKLTQDLKEVKIEEKRSEDVSE